MEIIRCGEGLVSQSTQPSSLRVKFSSDAGGCRDILIERLPDTSCALHHFCALSATGLNSSAALGVAELGRELHGMFTKRREVTTRDDVRQLTDAELRERMAQAIENTQR